MAYGFKLKAWGDYACFTRPEMKVERVSYDVMTPSAARGILEAIYWKPAIRWHIDKIHVINEIKVDNIRRNEVDKKISAATIKKAMKDSSVALYQDINQDRQQRASIILKDVCYVIECSFSLTDKKGAEDTEEKHYNMALRRMRAGQCFHRPYFGCREFDVHFELLEENDAIPTSFYQGTENNLGFMLYDIDFANKMTPMFFKAKMVDGIIKTKEAEVFQ